MQYSFGEHGREPPTMTRAECQPSGRAFVERTCGSGSGPSGPAGGDRTDGPRPIRQRAGAARRRPLRTLSAELRAMAKNRARSVRHSDQRRGFVARAGLVRCVRLSAGPFLGTPDSTPHSTIFLVPKAATSSRFPPSAVTYRCRVDTWQSSNSSRLSSRDTSAWSICDCAATSTCVFPAASRTTRIVRRTPRWARRPRPSTRTGSLSGERCRFADMFMSDLTRFAAALTESHSTSPSITVGSTPSMGHIP